MDPTEPDPAKNSPRVEMEMAEAGHDLAAFRKEVFDGLHRIAGSGIARDIYAEDEP